MPAQHFRIPGKREELAVLLDDLIAGDNDPRYNIGGTGKVANSPPESLAHALDRIVRHFRRRELTPQTNNFLGRIEEAFTQGGQPAILRPVRTSLRYDRGAQAQTLRTHNDELRAAVALLDPLEEMLHAEGGRSGPQDGNAEHCNDLLEKLDNARTLLNSIAWQVDEIITKEESKSPGKKRGRG